MQLRASFTHSLIKRMSSPRIRYLQFSVGLCQPAGWPFTRHADYMRGSEITRSSLGKVSNVATGAEGNKFDKDWCTAAAYALHIVQWTSLSVLVKDKTSQEVTILRSLTTRMTCLTANYALADAV